MHVRRRIDHSFGLFLKRTLAAQLHALGCVLMMVGAFILLPLAHRAGAPHVWACASFLATGTLVFLVSSVYHFLSDGYESSEQLHLVLENLDHFSIYLFIAGTYSPFLLSAVSSPWRMPLLVTIWSIAVLGITYTWLKPRLPKILQHRAFYTGIFVVMGWTLVIRIGEVFAGLSNLKLFFLVAGGLAYSVGALVYAFKRPRLFAGVFGFHELWHLLVLLGAGCHYFMILSFYRA